MNRIADKNLNAQSLKRGELARKLLKAATRSKRSSLPSLAMLCDDDKAMNSESARVLGPYRNGEKWRLIVREGKGRKSLVFDTREHAESARGTLLASLSNRACRLIGDTVDEFLTHKVKRLGITARTIKTTRHQLSRFLPFDETLASITPDKAEALYMAATEKYAAATHHIALRQAKAFFGYCVKQKYMNANPFAEVQSIGKAKAGKPQLRTDEAKKLSDVLLESAQSGDMRALGLMVQVLLGLRSGEVLNLRKRDIDWVHSDPDHLKFSDRRRRAGFPGGWQIGDLSAVETPTAKSA
jgi:integrase